LGVVAPGQTIIEHAGFHTVSSLVDGDFGIDCSLPVPVAVPITLTYFHPDPLLSTAYGNPQCKGTYNFPTAPWNTVFLHQLIEERLSNPVTMISYMAVRLAWKSSAIGNTEVYILRPTPPRNGHHRHTEKRPNVFAWRATVRWDQDPESSHRLRS
jgi:hypothetical protein